MRFLGVQCSGSYWIFILDIPSRVKDKLLHFAPTITKNNFHHWVGHCILETTNGTFAYAALTDSVYNP